MIPRDSFPRFWSKVEVSGDCWLWQAHTVGGGYGRFHFEGRSVLAHRLAYELLVGQIPAGLDIDHLCRNPGCVNPAHLEPVTHRENCARGLSHHAAKTQCPQGHPYDAGNVYVHPKTGKRNCRECVRQRNRQYQRERRLGLR